MNISVKLVRKSTLNSPFVSNGEYLKKFVKDSYFDIQNFETIKIGKRTKILGKGAFGDVYLAKSLIDGELRYSRELR
jgi:hypothetical protein